MCDEFMYTPVMVWGVNGRAGMLRCCVYVYVVLEWCRRSQKSSPFASRRFISSDMSVFFALCGVVAAFRFATCLRPVGETAL